MMKLSSLTGFCHGVMSLFAFFKGLKKKQNDEAEKKKKKKKGSKKNKNGKKGEKEDFSEFEKRRVVHRMHKRLSAFISCSSDYSIKFWNFQNEKNEVSIKLGFLPKTIMFVRKNEKYKNFVFAGGIFSDAKKRSLCLSSKLDDDFKSVHIFGMKRNRSRSRYYASELFERTKRFDYTFPCHETGCVAMLEISKERFLTVSRKIVLKFWRFDDLENEEFKINASLYSNNTISVIGSQSKVFLEALPKPDYFLLSSNYAKSAIIIIQFNYYHINKILHRFNPDFVSSDLISVCSNDNNDEEIIAAYRNCIVVWNYVSGVIVRKVFNYLHWLDRGNSHIPGPYCALIVNNCLVLGVDNKSTTTFLKKSDLFDSEKEVVPSLVKGQLCKQVNFAKFTFPNYIFVGYFYGNIDVINLDRRKIEKSFIFHMSTVNNIQFVEENIVTTLSAKMMSCVNNRSLVDLSIVITHSEWYDNS